MGDFSKQQQATQQKNQMHTGMNALRAKMQKQSSPSSPPQPQIQKPAPNISFDKLRSSISGAALEEKTRKDKEAQLKMLLEHALFLNSDEARRKRWIESIPQLPDELLQNLLGAVIRENLRFKKGTRDLVIELNKKNINGQK